MAVKILIVDDEPDLEVLIRQKFRESIRSNEYAFEFARNGVEALAKIEEDPGLEIIFTDINMPEMDGLTLLSRMREHRTHFKAAVLSAYDDMDNIRTAMNRGAFDFLTKPLDFDDLEATIVKAISELDTLKAGARAQRRLVSVQQELEVAAEIQQSILPKSFPGIDQVDLYAEMRPAKTVGGDFYDFFVQGDDHLVFVVADVAGKGVPAALFMAITRTLVRATSFSGNSPSECVSDVNDLLCSEEGLGLFVTLFYGLLNLRTGELTHANAGHNPPYLVKGNGKVSAFAKSDDLVLGVQPGLEYESRYSVLAPGDTVVLYTDGVVDAADCHGTRFGDGRLTKALKAVPGDSASATIGGLLNEVAAHADGARQADDITTLAVRYCGERGA